MARTNSASSSELEEYFKMENRQMNGDDTWSEDSSTENIFGEDGPKVNKKERKKNRKDFMSWFDSLGYNPEDKRVEEAQAAMYFLKNPYRGGSARKGKKKVRARYLDGPTLNPMLRKQQQEEIQREEEAQRAEEKEKANSIKLPKIPRVATIKPPKHWQITDDKSNTGTTARSVASVATTLGPSAEDLERKQEGSLFWTSVDFCKIILKARVGFLPTLIFDIRGRMIRWVCFEEEAMTFDAVQQLSPNYSKILQSLCFYNSSPLVSIQSIKHGCVVEKNFAISRGDLVSALEKLCTLYTKETGYKDLDSIVLQAIPPANLGSIVTVSQGPLVKRVRKVSNIEYLQAQVLSESDILTGERKQFVMDIDWFIEKEVKEDGSILKTQRSRKSLDVSESEDPVVARQRKKFELQQAFKWCIGEFCKKYASLEELEAIRHEDRHQVVYKLVLQHRMGITDSNELSNKLPPNLRNRMYESVKVCSVCFNRLMEIEEERIAIEKKKAEKAKCQRQKAKSRRLGRTCATKAAQVAREMLRKKREDSLNLVKESKSSPAPNAEVEAFIQLLEANQLDSTSSKLEIGAEKETEAGYEKEESDEVADGVSTESFQDELPQGKVEPQVEESVQHELVEFNGITCSSFFGNDSEKLLLCQGIMDTLREKKQAKLFAPITENNMSIEECRLVLRSLYLEFRGLCVDQGYFPEVPLEGENAIMVLQPIN